MAGWRLDLYIREGSRTVAAMDRVARLYWRLRHGRNSLVRYWPYCLKNIWDIPDNGPRS